MGPDSFDHDFFLAGVMQGSHVGKKLHSQDYRDRLKALIEAKCPGSRVFDPLAEHGESVNYSDEAGLRVFRLHIEAALRSRVLVCYLPVASMGTAIEMWECHRNGNLVLAISPMATNWIVRFFSHRVFPDIESFGEWLNPANLEALGRLTAPHDSA